MSKNAGIPTAMVRKGKENYVVTIVSGRTLVQAAAASLCFYKNNINNNHDIINNNSNNNKKPGRLPRLLGLT